MWFSPEVDMHAAFFSSDERNPKQMPDSSDSFHFSTRNATPDTCSGCISENQLFTPMVRVQKIKLGYSQKKWAYWPLIFTAICPCCERHLDTAWYYQPHSKH